MIELEVDEIFKEGIAEEVLLYRQDGHHDCVEGLVDLSIGITEGQIFLKADDAFRLELKTRPVLRLKLRQKEWHVTDVGEPIGGLVPIQIDRAFAEQTHSNIRDLNDEQMRWSDHDTD